MARVYEIPARRISIDNDLSREIRDSSMRAHLRAAGGACRAKTPGSDRAILDSWWPFRTTFVIPVSLRAAFAGVVGNSVSCPQWVRLMFLLLYRFL
jgi:hypothetical protein